MTTQPAARRTRVVDIVMPAVRDVGALLRCLRLVFASTNETPFEVIIAPANAGSGVQEAVRESPYAARVAVLAPGAPLARALARNRDRDIVLLAPDAEVHANWLDRLALHARSENVAVVGTFSNAGRAAAYPRAGVTNPLPQGETSATLDACFARTNAGRVVAVAAIDGPCLYVTREAIIALGDAPIGNDERTLAETLGARAASAGRKCVVAGDVFVARHDAPAQDRKPPAANPVLALARRVDLARLAASPRPVIVFVSHAWGGGIRRYMNDLAALLRERADVLYLEPANGGAVKLSWPRDDEAFAAWFQLPADLSTLAAMLRGIGVVRFHFHHVHGMPQSILDLPSETGVPYDCTLHDYFAICPQYHLTDERGRYCGEPDRQGCATCLAHRRPQWPLDIDAWRTLFGEFLRDAERVIAPSRPRSVRFQSGSPAGGAYACYRSMQRRRNGTTH